MKRILFRVLCIFLIISLTACGKKNNSDSSKTDNSQQNGSEATVESGFQVIFFDIENSSDGTIHYDGDNNDKTWGYSGVKPADCYMIKTGNTEILVDAGIQLNVINRRTSRIYQENVIKKIERYCTDGVLEYLIVTHGDSDHISGLAVDGGIFDYCLKENFQIEKIIDFDSDLVRYFSEKNDVTSEYNKIVDSEIINDYRNKREKLVNERKTEHIPAASLFQGMSFLDENPMTTAMPDDYYNNYYLNDSLITNLYYFSNVVSKNDSSKNIMLRYTYNGEELEENNREYKSYYKTLNLDFGKLENKNERYYFTIELENDVELRILYNWFYDHVFVHTFDSKNRNNISVCFEVVCGEKEFASFGDLGGLGEKSIIKYYSTTNILNDIDCFKASHHGSTVNGENSENLFKLMKPNIVVVPGVAQISKKMAEQKGMTNDPVYSSLVGTSAMEKDFFSNIKSGYSDAKIYCTQILESLELQNYNRFISGPLYGDIIIKFEKNKVMVDCSYKGDIDCYISKDQNHFMFSNIKDGNILSYDETDHYKVIYQDN